MYTLLVMLHIIVCLIMISVILLQAGKGAEIGAAFGGSSQTIFGSRGPGTFLSKLTVAAAVIFMLTSLSLAVLSKERSVASTIPLPQESSAPPAGLPASQAGTNETPALPAAKQEGGTSAAAPTSPAPTASTPAVPAPAPAPKTNP
jgi:preprotein translocase subunit SecG